LGIASLPRTKQWRERNGTMTRGIIIREVSARESFPWGVYHKVIQLMELRMVGGKRATRPHHASLVIYTQLVFPQSMAHTNPRE
jgi:hypothetical protein